MKKNPVSVSAVYCAMEIFSVGRSSSRKDAPEIIHFDIGAQKWTVLCGGARGASGGAVRKIERNARIIYARRGGCVHVFFHPRSVGRVEERHHDDDVISGEKLPPPRPRPPPRKKGEKQRGTNIKARTMVQLPPPRGPRSGLG